MMDTEHTHSTLIRKPVFAGRFYPASEKVLLKQLKKLFAGATAPIAKALPQAIIAPHAGYIFSGEVAASAFSQLPEKAEYKRVFILASSHHSTFKGASICDIEFYETPLGKIRVDTEVTKKLFSLNGLMQYHADAHTHEHGVEVQLPFLQYRLGTDFLLVPVVLGTHDASECEKIAQMLEPWFTPENLFVISTDFSHYPAYEDAVGNDFNTAEAICSNSPDTLMEALAPKMNINNLATSLCGWTSVLTLLYLTRQKNLNYVKVQYRNSGDAPNYGEKERVVGYWAIAVYQGKEDLFVPYHVQAEMLKKARNAISHYIDTGNLIQAKMFELTGLESGGMFVSIYVKGELRGCIGNFTGGVSLNESLEHLAVSACCDQRFRDLKKDELNDMELEISVLSPLRQIHSIDEIELGKHGIYIQKGDQSGTFLPKVANTTGWTVAQLLGYCARDKARIGWNGWKDAEIYVYETFEFRETG